VGPCGRARDRRRRLFAGRPGIAAGWLRARALGGESRLGACGRWDPREAGESGGSLQMTLMNYIILSTLGHGTDDYATLFKTVSFGESSLSVKKHNH
jgi:hypothetical protein